MPSFSKWYVKILLCKISKFYGGSHELAESLRSYLPRTDLSRKIEGDSVCRVELAVTIQTSVKILRLCRALYSLVCNKSAVSKGFRLLVHVKKEKKYGSIHPSSKAIVAQYLRKLTAHLVLWDTNGAVKRYIIKNTFPTLANNKQKSRLCQQGKISKIFWAIRVYQIVIIIFTSHNHHLHHVMSFPSCLQ